MKSVQHFFLGVLIAFTISVIIIAAVMTFAEETPMIPAVMIWQSLILASLCSLINLVYRSEKLKFIWQSLIAYVLTTSTITLCGLIFNWYDYPQESLSKPVFILISFLVYSLFYLVTWLIIWRIAKAKEKDLNNKLKEYKLRQ